MPWMASLQHLLRLVIHVLSQISQGGDTPISSFLQAPLGPASALAGPWARDEWQCKVCSRHHVPEAERKKVAGHAGQYDGEACSVCATARKGIKPGEEESKAPDIRVSESNVVKDQSPSLSVMHSVDAVDSQGSVDLWQSNEVVRERAESAKQALGQDTASQGAPPHATGVVSSVDSQDSAGLWLSNEVVRERAEKEPHKQPLKWFNVQGMDSKHWDTWHASMARPQSNRAQRIGPPTPGGHQQYLVTLRDGGNAFRVRLSRDENATPATRKLALFDARLQRDPASRGLRRGNQASWQLSYYHDMRSTGRKENPNGKGMIRLLGGEPLRKHRWGVVMDNLASKTPQTTLGPELKLVKGWQFRGMATGQEPCPANASDEEQRTHLGIQHADRHWRAAVMCSEIIGRIRPSVRCEACYESALTLSDIDLEQFDVSFCHHGELHGQTVCYACDADSVKKRPVKLAQTRCHIGFQPYHLPSLTLSEEMMLARVHVRYAVHIAREGGLSFRGHCYFLVQDQLEIANVWPQHPSTMPMTIIRAGIVQKHQIQHIDFLVRPEVMIQWARYLATREYFKDCPATDTSLQSFDKEDGEYAGCTVRDDYPPFMGHPAVCVVKHVPDIQQGADGLKRVETGLSQAVAGTTRAMGSQIPDEHSGGAAPSGQHGGAFEAREHVMYTHKGGAEECATILSVHHDDLAPYYTIELASAPGVERQVCAERLKRVGNVNADTHLERDGDGGALGTQGPLREADERANMRYTIVPTSSVGAMGRAELAAMIKEAAEPSTDEYNDDAADAADASLDAANDRADCVLPEDAAFVDDIPCDGGATTLGHLGSEDAELLWLSNEVQRTECCAQGGATYPTGQGVGSPTGQGVASPAGQGVAKSAGQGVASPVGQGVASPVGQGVAVH